MHTGSIDWGALAGLRCLIVLDLSSNYLKGNIPEALAGLVSLERLDLHRNKFYGNIPHELGQLPRLKRLRLNNNNLSGQIPEEVASMPTLELFDCSMNKLSGLLPAWACMATVYGKSGDPHPNQMYLFVMDAPPKSLRAASSASASARDEEARARAAAWVQWHLDRDDVPAAVEEQSPQLGDTQVLSVDLPQRGKATVRFEVKATSGTSSFIFASGTVFGAVNPASATTVRGFPHRVADINGERQGRGLVASVGANVRSIAARVTGVAVREYHPLLGTRQDGRVEPDGDNDADASPAPALLPSPCSSFVLKRDDDFMDAWEEFVRRDERCNNSVCWFVRNFDFPPLSSVVGVAMFFTPLWGMLFLFPLLWVLGVMACTLLLLATLTAVLMLLKELLSFPCHGDIGRSAVAVLHIIICALACYCVVMFGVYMPFGVIMTGECVLVYGLRYVLVTTLICCGVLKSDKVPPLEIAVEPQPPSWVPALDLAVEP